MSGAKHTAGPWHVGGEYSQGEALLYIGAPSSPMILASMNEVHVSTRANATRIVACVNALEGIDDPAAFREAFGELVEALGDLMPTVRCMEKHGVRYDPMQVDAAVKALAKAKEFQS